VHMGCVSLAGISYLVLDEADRMLDQGFEYDIREIIGMTHKDRQTCLFSATWPETIRNLAREFLTDPVKVTVGSDSLSANKKIKQIIEVIDERDKDDKLMKVLQKYTNAETKNRMIVFVLKKAEAYDLEDNLLKKGYKVDSIHGDKTQWEREYALEQFKDGSVNLLVATDVAAR
jgi:ATP-dependent RNA helicase DBP3